MRVSVPLWCLLVVLGIGCQRTPAPAPAPAPAAPAAPPAAMAPQRPLLEQLKHEQAQAASVARARAVLDRLRGEGIEIGAPKQFLGRTVGATYCTGGSTPQGLVVSVCDFENPDTARAGVERIQKLFPDLKHRQVLQRDQVTLTLVSSSSDDPTKSRAARVFTAQ